MAFHRKECIFEGIVSLDAALFPLVFCTRWRNRDVDFYCHISQSNWLKPRIYFHHMNADYLVHLNSVITRGVNRRLTTKHKQHNECVCKSDLCCESLIWHETLDWDWNRSVLCRCDDDDDGVFVFMLLSEGRTVDGCETHFATNYLGHFLLTRLLLETLMHSGKDESYSGIIHVSSSAHYAADLRLHEACRSKNTFLLKWNKHTVITTSNPHQSRCCLQSDCTGI